MPKAIEFDRLEFVLENFHDFLLGENNKLRGVIYNLERDLIL